MVFLSCFLQSSDRRRRFGDSLSPHILVGLTVETLLLAPLALGYLVYLSTQHSNFLVGNLRLDLLLPLSGVITAIPLLCFVSATRLLRLTTIGFLQYITPSLHFVLAVGLYAEPFSHSQLVSFLVTIQQHLRSLRLPAHDQPEKHRHTIVSQAAYAHLRHC